MGILARIFGSDATIRKGIDTVVNAGDAMVFTNEEKSEYFLRLLRGYEPFKLAQRLLALVITLPYVLVWLACAVLYAIGAFNDGMWGAHMMAVSNALAEKNNDTLGLPVSLVLGFYFGGGTIAEFRRAKKD